MLAALGPKMLELSASAADGAHPYFSTPDHTATAREIIGPDKLLCVEQKVILSTDADAARAAANAAREARSAWRPWYAVAAVFLVLAALVPLAAPSWVHVDSLANGFYLALAATGLWITVGLAGMPSLGQGAFMGIGAFTVALLTAKAGWPAFPATLVGVVAAGAAGILAGVGVVRLRPVFIAVTTWILTWTVTLFLLAFRSVSGGAQGIVVPSGLSVDAHYEVALALLAITIVVGASLSRAGAGIELRAARQVPAAAAALGVATARRRLGAFVASAAIGGLAGGLAVQLAGVADAGEYGPYLSFRLLVAVLIGGVASAFGPAAGVAGLALVTGAAGVLGAVEGVESARFDPMLAALLLLAVLALGGEGIVPLLRSLVPRPRRELERRESPLAATPRRSSSASAERPPPLLVADSLTKRFGNVVAADAVSLELAPGEVCALVGPNGSGRRRSSDCWPASIHRTQERSSSTASTSRTHRLVRARAKASYARFRARPRSAS